MANAQGASKALHRFVLAGLIASLASCDGAGRSETGAAAGAAPQASAAQGSSGKRLHSLLAKDGRLKFPADYREWVFLSSGHGMSYTPGSDAGQDLPFDNVFVDPSSYRTFLKTGTWPEGTIFVLEIRPGRSQGSINKRGAFQHGEPSAIEIHVKDSARFPTGWAFFSFSARAPATVIPTSAACYSCHQQNGAVDTTFVQFYPTLLPIAHDKKTLTETYLKTLGAETPSGGP